ncbi:hypothetical protein CPT_Sycamore_036 [Streptomyces phage Sycamore]|uniref:Uncharacterized protein n=1 Tax=Streptomyces phage Sycamore TaxID=2767589 RepID=A0A873WJB6_9CAUD|nr:hypothetical protein CPT_Sycamore_036 [Streptomyces phage Sycamore]
MQTVITPDAGTITARRTLVGFDLEVKNPEGETIATVIVSDAEAWDLFKTLGEELNA